MRDWFEQPGEDDQWHTAIVRKWTAAGVLMAEERDASVPRTLEGVTVVVTGSLERVVAGTARRRRSSPAAGRPPGSVSKKTDFVVVGENAGTKEARARELGLRILDEAGFARLLAEGPAALRPRSTTPRRTSRDGRAATDEPATGEPATAASGEDGPSEEG